MQKLIVLAALCAATSTTAFCGGVEVIYTEIATSPTANVTGAKDALGNPAPALWTAMFDLVASHDGTQWVVRGSNNLGSTLDSMLVLGSGAAGSVLFQDGQPIPGAAGESFDFFDSVRPVTWDDAGNIGLSFRAKGGVTADDEKLCIWDGANLTILMKQGDPYFGLFDIATAITGDEIVGNSIGSVQLLNTGVLSLVNTPIGNCSSFRYPALMHTNNAFRQSGVSLIGTEIWDSFVLDGAGGTPDGLHWYAEGDTENTNTTIDGIFVVDNSVVLQENSLIPGTAKLFSDVFHTRMLADGQWYTRGDDSAADDFALRNDGLVVKTGDPITPGNTELWGVTISNFTGSQSGDWVIVGNTNNANTAIDTVMVFNGGSVLCREGDPVDVDSNGLFDDNAFINSFGPDDTHLVDVGSGEFDVFFLATLRNAAGTGLGDSLLRIEICGSATAYGAGCAGTGGFIPVLGMTGCVRAAGNVNLGILDGLGGSFAVFLFGTGQGNTPMDGGCSLLIQTLLPSAFSLPLPGAGAGAGDLLIPVQILGNTPSVTFTMQVFVADPGVPQGFSNSNGLEVTING